MSRFSYCINESTFWPDEIPDGWVLGRLKKNCRSASPTSAFGSDRSPDISIRQIKTRTENYKNNPERYNEIKEAQRKSASLTHKGVAKSAESNLKRARPGMTMLKNKLTGECIRVYNCDDYNRSIWVNPSSLCPASGIGSRWTTDGQTNIKIKLGGDMPAGFHYGRTRK